MTVTSSQIRVFPILPSSSHSESENVHLTIVHDSIRHTWTFNKLQPILGNNGGDTRVNAVTSRTITQLNRYAPEDNHGTDNCEKSHEAVEAWFFSVGLPISHRNRTAVAPLKAASVPITSRFPPVGHIDGASVCRNRCAHDMGRRCLVAKPLKPVPTLNKK